MLLGFAAAVLGGFGSIGGVVAGGVAIGLVEQLLGGYILIDYKHIFPFVLMLAVIAVRPQGLFGRATARRL
jgi:branched-chain amino acid transport system permease protein